MHLGPDVWGPHGWKFLHFITIGYPNIPSNDDKKKYKTFFSLIQHVLPCRICADNYNKHIKQHPLSDNILSDKTKFINWCIKMHNLVNSENKSKVYSDEEALKLILKEKSCHEINNINKEIIVIFIVVISIVLLLLYNHFYKKLVKR